MFFLFLLEELFDRVLVIASSSFEWSETPICQAIEEEQTWETGHFFKELGPNYAECNGKWYGLLEAVDVDADCFVICDVGFSEEGF